MSCRYERVFWDWNGTLLDDVEVCIESMNELLGEYSLPPLESLERYHSVFGFPVSSYYERLGFDFSKVPFERTGMEFIEKYDRRQQRAGLAQGAEEALGRLRSAGLMQAVLSASERGALKAQIEERGITEYFCDILGIGDRLAGGKADIARRYFEENGIDPARAVFIGDTSHDYEVARSLGCECILVAGGHQSRSALETLAGRAAVSLSQAADWVLG